MTTVLLVVDIQEGSLTEKEPVFESEHLIGVISKLVQQARSEGLPVAFVQHCGGPGDPDEPGTDGHPIHRAIAPQDGEVVVQKKTPDAFRDTGLEEQLKKLGADRLVICGLQTELCIDTTTRRAFSLGYDVTLVADAHSTWDGPLPAKEKIDYHNEVLGWVFAKVVKAEQALGTSTIGP